MQDSKEQAEDNDLREALEEIIKKTEEMEKRIEKILSRSKRQSDQ